MPPKRKQRAAAAKASKAIKEEVADSSEEELEQDTPTDLKLVFKKPKISESSRVHWTSATTSKTKLANKGKRNAGKLKQLKDMPIEIFFEITSWLHPSDLLRLSRVSKYFREMFTSRSSKALWIRARRQFKGMPDCPDSISEPQYAALVFENLCQACGVARAPKFDYAYLVRFCGACHKENVINGKKLLRLYPKSLDPVILQLIPAACGEDYHPRNVIPSTTHNDSTRRYYKPQFEAIADRLMTLNRGSPMYTKFVDEMKENAKNQLEFNHAMHLWLQEDSREKAKAQQDTTAQRKASIIAKLLEMGYSRDDFPQGYVYEWYTCLNQPRPLTTRIWNQIKGRLVECIEHEKKIKQQRLIERRKHELSIKLKSHYDGLLSRLNEFEYPVKQWYPTLHDATRIPAVNAILSENDAQVDLTQERIQQILDIIESDVTDARERTETRLLSELREVYVHATDGTEIDLPEILDRKYLYFSASRFKCPQSCCTSYEFPLFHPYEELSPQRYPRRKEEISVNVVNSQISRKVVRMLGLPDDHLAKDLPSHLICDCLKPNVTMPMTYGRLLQHLSQDRAWYKDMTEHLKPHRDFSLVLHDDHDLDSSTPFIHAHTFGESTQKFEADDWEPNNSLKARTGFGCNECEKLSSAVTRHRWHGDYVFRSPSFEVGDQWMRFIHHMKTKHQHDPREEDCLYYMDLS